MNERLPSGQVTFLFTDIEGSTRLVRDLGGRYGQVLADHRRLLREVWQRWRGVELGTEGDSFFVVFGDPAAAVAAAADGQRALAAHAWPADGEVRVRMGMHTGAPLVVDGDYFGIDVNRAARIAGAAHGGQVLMSRTTRELAAGGLPAGAGLRDLGEHRLKDLDEPEWLFQLLLDGLDSEFAPVRSLEVPSNLPHPPTSLVGRDGAAAEIAAILLRDDVRLLTLTGPGGAGKTRLAIEAAARVRDRFLNGTYFVALAPLADPDDVLPAIAQTLGIEIGSRPIAERLGDGLRVRSLLLVLDNFEHVAPAAAAVAPLLAEAPRLKALVTSRASLHIAAEREYAVTPLGLPGDDRDLAALASSPAVALFVERARAVKPTFALTAANGRAVAEICRRLDGLPLAIELAAARIRTLGPEQLLARLASRLPLPGAGRRDLPARQQTLRDTIGWSVDLLDAATADLFRRFAVFAGGAASDAVEAVLGGERLAGLEVLVDHNLVRVVGDSETRFEMLQTIREFAGDALEASGAGPACRVAHATYFAGLAAKADEAMRGPDQAAWRRRLELEAGNMRAALAWAFDDPARDGRGLLGARIAVSISWYWYTHGDALEGCRWLEQAHRVPDLPASLRATIGHRLGILCDQRGDAEQAARLFEDSLASARAIDDRHGVARALNSLGSAVRSLGDGGRAQGLFAEALALREALADRSGMASSNHNLGVLALDRGDGAEARERFQTARRLDEALGNEWGVALGDAGIAEAALALGDPAGALEPILAALRCFDALGEQDRLAEALAILGDQAAAAGDPLRAARLLGAAWSLWASLGLLPVALDLARHQRRVDRVRGALGDPAFDAARREGEAMTRSQAVAFALQQHGNLVV
jgi:predicted ATPase/class 3 adenylate cyclase